MNTHIADGVSQATIREYRERGATVLRGLFKDWVEPLARGVDANIREPSELAKGYTPDGKPGRFFGDYCSWQRIAEYEDFIRHSPAAAVAGRLSGASQVRFFHEHVLVKEPETEERTPWHHDQPYYCVEGTMNCSLWVPLDPVPQDVCVEFVAGSHAWGRRFLPRMFSGVDYERPQDGLEPIIDVDRNRDQYDILSWDLEPGDALAFHFLTVHGRPPILQRVDVAAGFQLDGWETTQRLRNARARCPHRFRP